MRGLSMLNREYYEINPEEIAITFSDVKGVSLSLDITHSRFLAMI